MIVRSALERRTIAFGEGALYVVEEFVDVTQLEDLLVSDLSTYGEGLFVSRFLGFFIGFYHENEFEFVVQFILEA